MQFAGKRVLPAVLVLPILWAWSAATALGQACGTENQFCNGNASCDDGDPCNGVETCSPPDIIRFCRCDATPPCDDGNPCTLDTCIVNPRGITCDHGPGGCSDGVFCNGLETCAHSTCVAGTAPCAEGTHCDEGGNRCVECLNDSDCVDGDYCTTDTCNVAEGICGHVGCSDLFCDGRQLCGLNSCRPGAPPCSQLEFCDEENNTCTECEVDADCDDGDACTIATCNTSRHACRIEPCVLAFDSPAAGSVLEIGQKVEVTGIVSAYSNMDVVLVLDESGSLDSNEFQQLQDFAVALVNGLPFPESHVGVSMFSSGSRRIIDLNGNRTIVVNAINAMQPLGGSTCIGCGIDDGVENSYFHRRENASQVMVVVTDGLNNLPSGISATHLMAALQAAAFHRLTIFAVGVGDANPNEISLIASDIPGVQTAFFVNDFNQLSTILNSIILGAGLGNVTDVGVELPDASDVVAPVGPGGQFTVPDWTMLPGENHFTATIVNPYFERTAFLNLIGVYACHSTCGDLNGDTSADLRDVAAFMVCFNGRSWDSPLCGCSDLVGSTTVDLIDYAAMRSSLDNPTEDSPPQCLP